MVNLTESKGVSRGWESTFMPVMEFLEKTDIVESMRARKTCLMDSVSERREKREREI